MTFDPLYRASLILIFLYLVIIFPACALLANYVGSWLSKKYPAKTPPSNFVPSTILGLLALLLGFTFSMVVSRYDARKNLVMQEANAIGTAYLRAGTLVEPYRSELQKKLHNYTKLRIDFYEAGIDVPLAEAVLVKTAFLQDSIWSDVKKLTEKNRDALTSLFVIAMNAVIDISGERLFALENHVPETVYILIFIVTIIGVSTLGFIEGRTGTKSKFGILTLSVLFAVVIVIIQDMDRPRRGLIRVSEKSLYTLERSFHDQSR